MCVLRLNRFFELAHSAADTVPIPPASTQPSHNLPHARARPNLVAAPTFRPARDAAIAGFRFSSILCDMSSKCWLFALVMTGFPPVKVFNSPVSPAKVPIRKRQILLPIVGGDIVLPGSKMIPDRIPYRLIRPRHRVDSQSGFAEERVDRLSPLRGQKFPLRIRPQILHRARHIHRPRRDQTNQLVLIHRQPILPPTVFLESSTKPMGKRRGDPCHRLPELPPAQGRTATARIVGNHDPKPLVLGPGPKRGFPQPRMPQ